MKTLTVGDYECRVGENAEENWKMLDRANKKHWFFHLTDFPSCYVILECSREPSVEDKMRCAEICVENTRQRKSRNVKVDVTLCSNVVRSDQDEVGECDYRSQKKVQVFTVERVREESAVAPAAPQAKASPAPPQRPQGVPAPAAEGEHLSVKKHATMGCAVVKLCDPAARPAMLALGSDLIVGEVRVKLQPQVDKTTQEEVPDELFAAWGRKVEKESPLAVAELLLALEVLYVRATTAGEPQAEPV